MVTLAAAEDLPAHGQAVTARFGPVTALSSRRWAARSPSTTCRCATTCAAAVPVRRAAARRRGAAQHQREPLPAAARAGRRRHGRAVAAAAVELHRYPDRDAVALRDRPRRLPHRRHRRRRSAARTSGPPTGPTRSCSRSCRPSAGPAARRVGFEPSYSMHPIIASGTRTEWLRAPRRADFAIDVDAAAAVLRERAPDVTFLTSPNNPTGQSLEPAELAALVDAAPGIVVVDEAYAEFSDRPSAITLLPTHGRKLIVVAHDEQGVRLRRRPAGLPRRRAGRRRRVAARPAALPPLVAHPGGGARGAAARRRHARLGGAAARRARPGGGRRWPPSATTSCPAMPTSCCSAGSPTPPRAWRAFLDRGVLIRDVGIPERLRVTIGTPEENDTFLQVAADVVERELRR